MTIAVAVSGGADSLFALANLREQGEQVLALHGHFHDAAETDNPALAGLSAQCKRLGVPLHVVDLRAAFHRLVVSPFVEGYLHGQTPNPCALCNPRIKFGLLMDEALRLGADRFATGHYAGLIPHAHYGFALCRGADSAKDQSYFLALVPKERLMRAVFPLAGRSKPDIRAWLAERDFKIPVPRESQEICFVPRDDYRAFLRAAGVKLPGPGPIMTSTGTRVGTHQGLWNHTEGQRRGLGIAWEHPLYVIGKKPRANTLLVGGKDELLTTQAEARDINLLVPPSLWPETCLVRIRYRQAAEPATVALDGDIMRIDFHTPQPAGAPGQVAAVFDAQGVVLAGGLLL